MRFRVLAVSAVVVLAIAIASAAAQPVPSVSTTFIDFGTIPTSSMSTKSFWVHNSGDTTLLTLITSTDGVRFDPQPTFIQVAAGDSAEIDVTFDPFNFGEHSATIIVRNLNALPESLFVDVTGTGGPESPVLGVEPSSFNVIMAEDQVKVRNLRITNNGGGSLSWAISEQPQGVSWLTQLPTSGSLPTSAFDDVEVTFNSTGLAPAVYSTTLRVTSIAGVVDVPVTVLVEGTPNLSLSATSLDFGRVYQGFSLDRTLTMFNTGTAVLFVDTLRITGNTDFTAFPVNAVLQPGQWQEVTVTFTPTADGPAFGNARIESNDTDQPFVNVVLTGDGSSLSPPVVTAIPDTIEISTFTGQIETRDIVLSNTGGDTLQWTASPAWANPDPYQGLNILVDHSHGTSSFFLESNTVIATLTNAGASFTINYSRITLPLLLNYDVLYVPTIRSGGSRWGADEIEAARDFVYALGGIIMDATWTLGFQNANDISAALGAGMTAGWMSGTGDGFTSYIEPSPITTGVDLLAVEYGEGLTSLSPPAKLLVRYDAVASRRHSGYAEFGGRLMIAGDEFHADTRVGEPGVDNLGFAMQAFGWVGRAPSAQIDKTSGAVAVGESDTIGVFVDATLLPQGNYPARIVINSNDPVTQTITIPVSVSVTGTALIELSDTSLAFNDRYVGVSQQKFITISNQGLEPLSIFDIALPDPSFTWTSSAGAPPFGIATAEVETLYVTFNPVSTGLHSAELTIASNAFNADTSVVALTGTGIDAVSLSAVPDSIHVTMVPESSTSVPLAIHNGASQDETVRMAFHETTGGPVETGVLFDNFEDADLSGWNLAANAATKEVVGTGGGNNSLFAYRESNAASAHYSGIHRLLPAVQPRAMSFWVRPDRDDQYTNYVTLRDGALREAVFFFVTGNGTFYVNANVGGNQAYTYTAGQWYHIEYRNIDWAGKHFDYVVNDSLVQADVPMRNSADVNEVSRLDLYHFDAGGGGEFDDIWMNYTSRPAWLNITPDVATVPGGGSTPFPGALSTAGVTDGTYEALASFATNDPLEPLLTVPVVLLVDSTVTGTGTPRPRQTALLQNVPNPFNPTTTLRFELAAPADIRLEIYSVRGARVRTLASGAHPAGSHAIEWDGRDQRGAQVASGVYFYRLTAGRFAQTRKMVLLK